MRVADDEEPCFCHPPVLLGAVIASTTFSHGSAVSAGRGVHLRARESAADILSGQRRRARRHRAAHRAGPHQREARAREVRRREGRPWSIDARRAHKQASHAPAAFVARRRVSTFAEVVALDTDEAGAETPEGSIGTIERADVAPAFADAAFELKMKEVSAVVETPFGFHLILRVE